MFLEKRLLAKILGNIQIDTRSNQHICTYNNLIGIVEKRKLTTYNVYAKKEAEIDVDITEAISDSSGKYLLLAEKNGRKLYLIQDNYIIWEKETDGDITRLHVNKNGYVAIIIKGTSYKSIVQVFDSEGKDLFKTYLSTTIATDVSISDDNKYVSFAEVNFSGTIVESTIKTISVEKTKENAQNSIIHTHKAASNSLINKIEYQDKNNLVCMYDDRIDVLQADTNTTLLDLNQKDKKTTFAEIQLNNNVLEISEEVSNIIKTKNILKFKNVSTRKENLYIIEGVIKKLYAKGNVVAVDMGRQIEFVNTNGWLVKNYTTLQEAKQVVIGNGIAGVVYKNKIEVINL